MLAGQDFVCKLRIFVREKYFCGAEMGNLPPSFHLRTNNIHNNFLVTSSVVGNHQAPKVVVIGMRTAITYYNSIFAGGANHLLSSSSAD